MQIKHKLPDDGGNPIRYLYHVSDVHIRNQSRHLEYRDVFNNLYKMLQKEDPAGLIVITGDIVHSKSQISPQLIIMLRDFLNNLASIMPVIMIAGNHDLNLSNLDIPDTLSSILHKTPIDNLFYLKESGIYQWKNVHFAVMSVLNYPLIKADEFDDLDGENQYKVGLLHATIHGSKICTSNTPLTSDRYKAGDFKGYDYVLLGDIHLHQFMNAEKTIGYAGSLIQQSFGEQLENHGYLRWDLATGKTELLEVPNQCGFINLFLKDDQIGPQHLAESISRGKRGMPRKVHVKIRILDPSPMEIAEAFIENMIVKDYIIIQRLIIPYTPMLEHSQLDSVLPTLDSEIPNLMNIEYQKKLLEEYLGSDHEQLIDIQDLHDSFQKQGSTELAANNDQEAFHWDLVSMEFYNAFSFKGTNFIDFSKFGGVVGIIGPNFSGKSNILDILLFALFDHASRGERNDIITANQTEMYIKLNFTIGPVLYTIHRIGKVSIGKDGEISKTKIDVRFFNGHQDLTGESRIQTNKIIQKYVGTYDDFVLTTLKLQQGGVGDLITLTNSQRKERFVDLLRLNVLDEYYKLAYGQLKDNKKTLDVYTKELAAIPNEMSIKLEQILDLLISEKTEMNKLKRQIEGKEDELNNLNLGLQQVNMELVEMEYVPDLPEIDLSNIKEMDKKLTNLSEKMAGLQAQLKPLIYGMTLDELEENIDLYRGTIVDHEEKIGEVEKSEKNDQMLLNALRSNQKDYKEQLKDWDSLYRRKIELSQWLKRVKENNQKLLTLEYDQDCKYCVNNVFVKEAIACQDQLADRQKELEEIEVNVNELEGIRSELVEVEDEMSQLQDNLNKQTSIRMERELKNWNDELNQLRDDFRSLRANQKIEEEIDQLKREREQIQGDRDVLWEVWEKAQLMVKVKAEKDKFEANRGLRETLELLRIDLSKLKERRSQLEDSIMKQSAEEQVLSVKIERQRDLELKVKRLRDQNIHLDLYCRCLSKDGIPKYLIEKYMPEFERIVNLIMEDLVNFKIKMDIGEKKWNLYVVYDDRQLNIDLCSGYEKFIVGLAIKCTLYHLSQMSKPQFMVIDEGFGALDSQHMSEIGRVLNYLRSKYQFILLITHIDSIKDELDQQLEIKKYGQYSKVNNKRNNMRKISLKKKS